LRDVLYGRGADAALTVRKHSDLNKW